jgi:hypothetical protein
VKTLGIRRPRNRRDEVIAYQDLADPTSIATPALVGYQANGDPYELRLDQHCSNVGIARSGIGSLIDTQFAHITRCHDAVLWVGGTEHLPDLVWPWVKRYVDTGRRLPIDWIAAGPWDTVRMLVAGIRVARWRQMVPPENRYAFKKIVIHLHQASFVLAVKTVYELYRDQPLNLAQAVETLVQGCGSAGVHFHYSSQRATNDALGGCGGYINANIGVHTLFLTSDEFEVGRVTGDYKLGAPDKPGDFWIRPGHGQPALFLKAPYLQDDTLHGGTPVSDIAWARRKVEKELDPGSAQAAGDHYARRFTTATNLLYPYLAGDDDSHDIS